MIYAPILITTLNRYDCLKKCIESLQRNSWAKQTELYISIDYPSSDKYVLGYQRIKSYLNKPIEGFKKVHLIFHDKNLGAIKNYEWSISFICKKYDRFIYLEDDNELAPGFIEFCDKGLEMFEGDKTIFAINASDYVWCGSGYTPPVRKCKENKNNVEKRQLIFHAAAFWREKRIHVEEFCESLTKCNGTLSFSNLMKLYNTSKCFFYQYLSMVYLQAVKLPWNEKKLIPIDFMMDIYMIVNDKYVIYPIEPLQRDLGVDGNGANYTSVFDNADELKSRILLSINEFNYCLNEQICINREEFKLHDQFMELSKFSKIKIIIKYIYRRMLNRYE